MNNHANISCVTCGAKAWPTADEKVRESFSLRRYGPDGRIAESPSPGQWYCEAHYPAATTRAPEERTAGVTPLEALGAFAHLLGIADQAVARSARRPRRLRRRLQGLFRRSHARPCRGQEGSHPAEAAGVAGRRAQAAAAREKRSRRKSGSAKASKTGWPGRRAGGERGRAMKARRPDGLHAPRPSSCKPQPRAGCLATWRPARRCAAQRGG